MAVIYNNDYIKHFTNLANADFKRAYGQFGIDKIADTNVHNGRWDYIKANGAANAVFNVLSTATGDNFDGMTLLAGDTVYGPFTSIDLTSGTVYAYKSQ